MRCVAAHGRPGGSPCPIITAALLALAIVGWAGCGPRTGQQEATSTEEAAAPTPVMVTTAMRGGIDETLELTGTAEASDEVDVVAEVSGKVAHVYADVGDYVRRGQTLVRVDSQIAAAQADQASAGVHAAEVGLSQAEQALVLTDETTASAVRAAEVGIATARERLKQAEAARDLVRSQVESQIEQARMALQSAETRLAEVRAGAREQQRRQAEAQVRQARANLDLAQQTYERYRRLFDDGVIPEQQLDQMRTQYQVALETHQQAVEALSLVEEGARTEDVRLAELAVEQARERLQLAEASRTQIEVAEQDVAAAEQGVRQAQEQLRSAEAARRQVELRQRDVAAARAGIRSAEAGRRMATVQLAKHAVPAPISGLVAMRNVDPGEGAMPGVPLMRLVDIDPIRVDAVVNELDVERVHSGDRGMVSFDGLDGESFVGTVSEITPQAVPGSRNYIARIEVENPGGRIRPGMFARVDLILASHSDSVLIVRDAVVESGDKRLVYAVVNGAVQVREVTLGTARGNLVEVLAGVREGDILVSRGQRELADGQSVRPVDGSEQTTDANPDSVEPAEARPTPRADGPAGER